MDEETPVPVRTSISSLFAQIDTTFSQLLAAIGAAGEAVSTSLPRETVEDQLGYFRLWAGNTGAHRKGRISLDHKLRLASHIHDKVTEYLTALNNQLHTVIELVENNGVPRPYSSSSNSSSSSEESFTSSTETSDESLPNISPLEYAFQVVAVLIKCLMRLSVVLRQPAPRDYKSKLHLPENMLAHYEPFDIGHVRSAVAQFACRHGSITHAAEGQETTPRFEAQEFLIERLGKANTQRRQLLRYLQNHHEKLSKYIDTPIVAQQNPAEPFPEAMHKAPTLNMSIRSQTTVTTVQQVSKPLDSLETDFMSEGAPTETSVGTAISSSAGYESKPEVPAPPKSAEPLGNLPFQCPFCYYMINPKNTRSWERHVFRDLKPFVCTFEDCRTSSTQLFESRREWASHERQVHRREWSCQPCELVSRNQVEFEEHMRSVHPEHPLMEFTITRYERAIVSHQNCNLCGKPCHPEQLIGHLGRHMMQIALFVLPKSLEDGDADDGNDGSALVVAGSSRTNSAMSSNGSSSEHADTSVHSIGLRRDLDSGNSETVAATVASLYSQIESQWPLACSFLETMACVCGEGLSADLFYKSLPEGVDVNAAGEALSKLVELGLITGAPAHEDSQFTMHALVQASIQNLLSTRGKMEAAVEKTAARLVRAQPHRSFSDDSDWITFLPHLLAWQAFRAPPSEDAASIYHLASENLYGTDRWKEAEDNARVAVDMRTAVLGAEHPDTIASMGNLTFIYQQRGKLNPVKELQGAVLVSNKSALGAEHTDTMASMEPLARTYQKQETLEEAEKLHAAALESRTKIFGSTHPNTLSSVAQLADTYRLQGRWKETAELQATMLDSAKGIFGEEHPATIVSIENLALTYQKMGRLEVAEKLHTAALESRTRIFGPENLHTLRTMTHLANTYRLQGKGKEAEELQAAVLEVRTRVLGPEHPDTLDITAQLADTYQLQGRWKETEELQAAALDLEKSVFGAEHPATLDRMVQLAHTYQYQGRLEEAEKLAATALDSSKRQQGADHINTLKITETVANIFHNAGRAQEAREMMTGLMELRIARLGDDNPDIRRYQETLARWDNGRRLFSN